MTVEQCAEMFSVVSDIKNEILEDEKNGGSKATSKIKDEKVNTALQLNLEEFRAVTSKNRHALRKLQNGLTVIRDKMRE